MHSDELEEAFSDFLDRHEYDDAKAALFSMVRLAFVAGGGGRPAPGGAPLRAHSPRRAPPDGSAASRSARAAAL